MNHQLLLVLANREGKLETFKKTRMKIITISIAVLAFAACKPGNKVPTFTVNGTFTNTGVKQVYLAELPFGSQERTVVDTASLDAKGQFQLSTPAKGEGLYQVFVENGPGIMLINDADELELHADAKQLAAYTVKGGKANGDMKKMFADFINADSVFRTRRVVADSLYQLKKADSAFEVARLQTITAVQKVTGVLSDFIVSQSNGTAVYFALGIARPYSTEEEYNRLLDTSLKKFPQHPGIALLKLPPPQTDPNDAYANQGKALVGKPVPDISLPDTSGKMITVSNFKGKWLLVDFWASWCGPCRQENPNVVAAFKQFRNKNFTILGVSLDQKREPWLKAIKQDGLRWTHISDLKYWDSKAVTTYGISGIPFNMLVDPTGKVVAVNLTGDVLQGTLGRYLGDND